MRSFNQFCKEFKKDIKDRMGVNALTRVSFKEVKEFAKNDEELLKRANRLGFKMPND